MISINAIHAQVEERGELSNIEGTATPIVDNYF
jgi:hypothetical protein